MARPPLHNETMELINVRLKRETLEILRQKHKATDVPVAAQIRRAVETYVESLAASSQEVTNPHYTDKPMPTTYAEYAAEMRADGIEPLSPQEMGIVETTLLEVAKDVSEQPKRKKASNKRAA